MALFQWTNSNQSDGATLYKNETLEYYCTVSGFGSHAFHGAYLLYLGHPSVFMRIRGSTFFRFSTIKPRNRTLTKKSKCRDSSGHLMPLIQWAERLPTDKKIMMHYFSPTRSDRRKTPNMPEYGVVLLDIDHLSMPTRNSISISDYFRLSRRSFGKKWSRADDDHDFGIIIGSRCWKKMLCLLFM